MKPLSNRMTATILASAIAAATALVVLSSTAFSTNDPQLRKSDRMPLGMSKQSNAICKGQAWPHYSSDCLASIKANAKARQISYLTREDRNGKSGISVLTRSKKVTLAAK